MNEIRYFKDNCRTVDSYKKQNGLYVPNRRIDSRVDFFDDETGERIFEPLHNKTVIAGSAFTAMKLFSFDPSTLNSTPTYDVSLGLTNGSDGSSYPVDPSTGVRDEGQRVICGFCVGQGGAGLDISDVFEPEYCSWITPDNIIPFRYPLTSSDDVDEAIYKGVASRMLENGETRNAYYFKTFSNTPIMQQNYLSTIGIFSDAVEPNSVYTTRKSDIGRTYVELHLKITKDDCREFFRAGAGIKDAKINQLSLVYAWKKKVENKKVSTGDDLNNRSLYIDYFQDIRPFSLLNFPNEALSDLEKSISIIYTLYF